MQEHPSPAQEPTRASSSELGWRTILPYLADKASVSTITAKLSALERNVATKADIANLKLWLVVTIGGFVLAGFGVALTLIRIWIVAGQPTPAN